MKSYQALLRFVEREGHARVTTGHREGDSALGRWVMKQRRKWREGRLHDEQRELLEAVPGWVWGREGIAQMPKEEEPRRGGHEWNFIVCGDDWRTCCTVDVLIGLGPMSRRAAAIALTKAMLGNEFVPERHLRKGSRMSWLVNHTLDEAVRWGNLDEPRPGYVRAVIGEGRALSLDRWKTCIRAAKIESRITRDELIRFALDQAVEVFGVDRYTLKQPEELVFLHEAIEQMIEAGEIKIENR